MKKIKRDKVGRFKKGTVSPRYQALYKNCAYCGKSFKTIKSHIEWRECCSRSCSIKMHHPRTDTGKHGKGKNLMKNGYYRVFIDDKWIYEHRYVMSQYLGRPLKRIEVIHHKDGNKQNNAIDNLILLPKKEHDRHETQRRWSANSCGEFYHDKT